jgi:hypothetical protein
VRTSLFACDFDSALWIGVGFFVPLIFQRARLDVSPKRANQKQSKGALTQTPFAALKA